MTQDITPSLHRSRLAIMIAGAAILGLSMGLRQVFGLFVAPMTLDLGIGRADFSLTIAAQNLLWGVVTPFLGAVADRYGTARCVALGGVAYAAGIALMASGDSLGLLWLGQGLLVGLGVAGAGFSLVLAAVARAAPPGKRSLYLGIASAGGSVGQFLLLPGSQMLIDSLEWRGALWVLAGLAVMIIPLSRVLSGKPAKTLQEQSLRGALSEALNHRGYLLLTAGFFVCGFQLAFIATHLPGYLVTCNLDASVGATALGIVGFFNIIGVLAAGALGERLPKKFLLAGIYFCRSLAIALFLLGPKTELNVWLFAGAFGVLWLSTVPLTSSLVAQIFGPRYMATLVAIVMLSHQVGSFFGAWLGGLTYDLTGNYDLVWYLSLGLGLLATALHLPIADKTLRPATA